MAPRSGTFAVARDGRTIYFDSRDPSVDPGGQAFSRIYAVPSDGSSPPNVVAGRDGTSQSSPAVSPDGAKLAYLSVNAPYFLPARSAVMVMRPALYDAWHKIDAVRPTGDCCTANVVGPVCETGDTFATAREMDKVEEEGLVVFRTAGAYAAAMSSTYNSRPLTPEVLVDGDRWAVVRPRVDIDRLIAADRIPEWLGGCAGADNS